MICVDIAIRDQKGFSSRERFSFRPCYALPWRLFLVYAKWNLFVCHPFWILFFFPNAMSLHDILDPIIAPHTQPVDTYPESSSPATVSNGSKQQQTSIEHKPSSALPSRNSVSPASSTSSETHVSSFAIGFHSLSFIWYMSGKPYPYPPSQSVPQPSATPVETASPASRGTNQPLDDDSHKPTDNEIEAQPTRTTITSSKATPIVGVAASEDGQLYTYTSTSYMPYATIVSEHEHKSISPAEIGGAIGASIIIALLLLGK